MPKFLLMPALVPPHVAATAAPAQILSLTAACQNTQARILDGVGMLVDLSLTNNSNETIGAPLPPELSLKNRYTPIPPGGSF